MDQKEYSPREEVTRVFLSEKFLYICILMTVTTLTGIIFSISNSSNTYSYFLNPIINELVNAAMSNVVSVFVVISYIPMIIGTGLLWLMRENARTNKANRYNCENDRRRACFKQDHCDGNNNSKQIDDNNTRHT